MRRAVEVLYLAREVHEAAAFGVYGHTGGRGLCDRLFHRGVCRKARREDLGEAAAEDETAAVGDFFVVERAEVYDLGSRRLEDGDAFGVVEGEGLVARDGDRHPLFRPRRGVGRCSERRGALGDFQERIEVDGRFDHLPDVFDVFAVAVFFHRQQPEVAFAHLRLPAARHGADDGQAETFYCLADHLSVVFGAVAVNDHASEVNLRVVVEEAFGDRRRALAHRADVDDEQHGGVKGLRDLCGAADAAAPAVVESHDALDYRDVRLFGGGEEDFFHRSLVGEPGVEVVGASARGEAEVSRVYVVRADFVWMHAQAARGERRDDAAGDRGLAAAAVSGGD